MIDPALEGWKQRAGTGFAGLIGPLWSRREGDRWAYACMAGQQHLNATGVVHGGLLVALADQAMSMTVWEATARTPCVTVQIDTHFIAAARAGDFIEARADIVKASGSLVFAQCRLVVGELPALTAFGIWKVLRPADRNTVGTTSTHRPGD